MIRAVIGKPGEGKGVAMVELGYEAQKPGWIALKMGKRPRPLYATFQLDDAWFLLDQRDLISAVGDGETWGMTRAVVLVDEQGIEADSRKTLDLDPLLDAAWRLHRKNGVDMYYAAQSLRQVDVRCRDLTAEVILVKRIWMDGGETVRRLQAGEPLRLIDRFRSPLGFLLRWYDIGQFDQETWLPKGKPLRFRFLAFNRRRSGLYNTLETVYPMHLAMHLNDLWESAAERLRLPKMRVIDGVPQPRELPLGYSFQVLEKMSPKHDMKTPLKRLSSDDDAVKAVLRRMEFYPQGELPEPNARLIASGAPVRKSSVLPFRGVIIACERTGIRTLEIVAREAITRSHTVMTVDSSWLHGEPDRMIGYTLVCNVEVIEEKGEISVVVAREPAPELLSPDFLSDEEVVGADG